MKVTKRVQEYIKEQVDKCMWESAKLKAAEKAADEADETWRIALNALREKFQAELDELASEHNYRALNYRGEEVFPTVSFNQGYQFGTPARREYNKLRNEMAAKRDKAVNDIIISLELGGTKEELEEMIYSNLKF